MMIARQEWTFRVVHGRQFLDGVECDSLIDPDAGEVRISDQISLGAQLEAAALAAVTILQSAVGLVPLVESRLA